MSCNCGCHHDQPPPAGWRRYAPFAVAVIVLAGLIAGATLKKQESRRAAHQTSTQAAAASP